MGIYCVRFRQVAIFETNLESESHKAALTQFKNDLDKGSLQPHVLIGVRYEIETITIGRQNDNQPEQDKPRKHPPPRSVRAKSVAIQKRHYRATDCESGASESGV